MDSFINMDLSHLMNYSNTPLPAINDASECYLCSIDNNHSIIKLLDNMDMRLCGKVKDNELWKAMAEAYAIQVKPLSKQKRNLNFSIIPNYGVNIHQYNA